MMDDFTSETYNDNYQGFTSDFDITDNSLLDNSVKTDESIFENYAEIITDNEDDKEIVSILKEIKDEIAKSRSKDGENGTDQDGSEEGTETGTGEQSGNDIEQERENSTEETTDQTEIDYTASLESIIDNLEVQNQTLIDINDNLILLGKNNALSQKVTISIISLMLGIIVVYVALGKLR